MQYAWRRDPLNMARASLVLLEPLPPVDVAGLTSELESANWQMLFALETRRSDRGWCERTSAPQWIGLLEQARRFNIPVDADVLRLLRATILYDTLAVRLDPEIDVIGQYRRFARYRARRAERRFERRVLREAGRDPERSPLYLHFDRLAQTGGGLLFRLRHALSVPRVRFSALMGQWAYTAYTAIRFAGQLIGAALVGGAAVAAVSWARTGQAMSAQEALARTFEHRGFHLIALLLLFLNSRLLWFRLDDKDA
jgi:hypothetical protein